MELPKWLSWVALAAMILTQLTAELGKIKPVYGVLVAFWAWLLALFTRSVIDNIFKLGKNWTVAGAVLIARTLITYAASPDWAALLGQHGVERLGLVGAILTIIGQGLKAG